MGCRSINYGTTFQDAWISIMMYEYLLYDIRPLLLRIFGPFFHWFYHRCGVVFTDWVVDDKLSLSIFNIRWKNS
jgi:hypothetical protein